jgi:hypothetical protein
LSETIAKSKGVDMPDGEIHSMTGLGEQNPLPGKLHISGTDQFGNAVREMLWRGMDYDIYRSDNGIFIRFSDDKDQEKKQRERFIAICPELCELRYLTSQMDGGPLDIWNVLRLYVINWLMRKKRDYPRRSAVRGLYDHNIAQALMLAMEGQEPMAKSLAKEALAMAVQRTTNDNTIRYVAACLGFGLLWIVISLTLFVFSLSPSVQYCLLASAFGAAGAVLSIITRVEVFELKPCQESGMNYWMSVIRVCMGVISGVVILLLASTLLSDSIGKLMGPMDLRGEIAWPGVALLGFLGGFSERMIPTILQKTAANVDASSGTPAQAIRSVTGLAVDSKRDGLVTPEINPGANLVAPATGASAQPAS